MLIQHPHSSTNTSTNARANTDTKAWSLLPADEREALRPAATRTSCRDSYASDNLGHGARQCGPPTPSLQSGLLKVSLKTGEATPVLVQTDRLAGVSWGLAGGMRVMFGSSFDEGVVVCDNV